jgi:hypothetical protein
LRQHLLQAIQVFHAGERRIAAQARIAPAGSDAGGGTGGRQRMQRHDASAAHIGLGAVSPAATAARDDDLDDALALRATDAADIRYQNVIAGILDPQPLAAFFQPRQVRLKESHGAAAKYRGFEQAVAVAQAAIVVRDRLAGISRRPAVHQDRG